MPNTSLSITNEHFTINGKLTYSDIPGTRPEAHGLLMNARFIQGVFDDAAAPSRFVRFGQDAWDAEANTDRLIAALPEWYRYGLRAFTVGLQGGGPCFTTPNDSIDNNPFSEDGTSLDPAYAGRLDRLIRAADEIGMAVIVSYFYQGQINRIADGVGIRAATKTASRFLREGGYTNVIVEVANEHDVGKFRDRQLIFSGEGMAYLIELAREETGGLPVGCSGGGGSATREIVEASDVILIHGNGQSRTSYDRLIGRVREWAPGRPVVCNEDSHAIGQLLVAYRTRSSWGYYNNLTKQEPPADWGVTPGEDAFFAWRMADGIGIEVPDIAEEDRFYLQGFEPGITHEGQRWIRIASLYPETVDFVEYFRSDELYATVYDEPFGINQHSNWHFGGVAVESGQTWRAVAHLADGGTVEKSAVVPEH